MKTLILELLRALVYVAGGAVDMLAPGILDKGTSLKHRLTAAGLAILLVLMLLIFAQGCMATTDLDGKVYTSRLDILTPIGQTVSSYHVNPPAPPATQPAR